MTAHKAFQQWKKAMGLGGWEIQLKVLPPAVFAKELERAEISNCNGFNCYNTSSRKSRIYIDDSASDRENVLVHELVHLLLTDYSEEFSDLIETLGDEGRRNDWVLRESKYLERAVQNITDAMIAIRDTAQK